MKAISLTLAAALFALSGAAYAADPTPMAKPTAAPTKPAATPRKVGDNSASKASGAKVRTPQSIECSKQANAKGVHGKDRKKFMSACKKGN